MSRPILTPILALASERPFTIRQAASQLGWSASTTRQRVLALLDMGLLQREQFEDESGRIFYVYFLSPLGAEFVSGGGVG